MIEIRYADELSDNEELVDILKRCVQGTDFSFIYDPSPNFFNRSRQYLDSHTLVAVEGDTIVGTMSAALMKKRVCGDFLKVAYSYGLNVCPNHRRKGIASKLKTRIEEILDENKADLIYNTIIKDNTASVNLQKKYGFNLVRELPNYKIMTYKTLKTNKTAIRPAEESDLKKIVELQNMTHEDYDLYKPYTEKEYRELVSRRPFYDLDNLLVYDEGGDVKAFLGYFDDSQITKMIVKRYANKHKLMILGCDFLGLFTNAPNLPKVGDYFREYSVIEKGFEAPAYFAELLKHLNNLAVQDNMHSVGIMCAEPPIPDMFEKYLNATAITQIYAKPLKDLTLTGFGENKIYY
jgi:ribosomal protein S18 acetylase RimI-like enzyme